MKTLNETEVDKYFKLFSDMEIEGPKRSGPKYEGRPMSDDCYDYNNDYGKNKYQPGGVLYPPLDKVKLLPKQVGGDHYQSMAIQPYEYIEKNKLTFLEGQVVKYVSRHRRKNGKEDILKAIHHLELILKMDYP